MAAGEIPEHDEQEQRVRWVQCHVMATIPHDDVQYRIVHMCCGSMAAT